MLAPLMWFAKSRPRSPLPPFKHEVKVNALIVVGSHVLFWVTLHSLGVSTFNFIIFVFVFC